MAGKFEIFVDKGDKFRFRLKASSGPNNLASQAYKTNRSALGGVASGFMDLTDTAKWISVAGMLLGRLEIFTLLVLITPTFWRT